MMNIFEYIARIIIVSHNVDIGDLAVAFLVTSSLALPMKCV